MVHSRRINYLLSNGKTRSRRYDRPMLAQGLSFAAGLKNWRQLRRLSQLDLALAADVSQRHVSFLETGRASPSRDMVVQLAQVLDVPLRDRNALLLAAGFAPVYVERGFDSDALAHVRRVLQTIVDAYGPIPAYVIDRSWTVALSNKAAQGLVGRFVDPTSEAVASGLNAARLVLHPSGLRRWIANWEVVAAALLDRIDHERLLRPTDQVLQSLADELTTYPDVRGLARGVRLPATGDLLVPIHLRGRGLELRLFTTVATIGSPYDITLEELRLETLLPADPRTEMALRGMSAG